MNFCIFNNHVTILILIKTRNEQKTTLKEATHVIKRNKFLITQTSLILYLCYIT